MCQLTILLLLVVGLGSLSACSGEVGRKYGGYVSWPNNLAAERWPAEETWVKLYRKLEDALLNSPELLDNLREKFFPSRSQHQMDT